MKTGAILPQAKECLWKRQGKVLPLQVSEGDGPVETLILVF